MASRLAAARSAARRRRACAPLARAIAVDRAARQVQLGPGRRPDLRRMGARRRRQLQHGVRLPEPEPRRGAERFRSARRTASSPGPADRGQPTYFYPRENHFLFRVNVPKDWDRKKELVWTVTANGKTETARATLLDVWEIDRKVEVSNNGGVQISNELIMRDQPPVVTIAPIARAKAGTPITLSAAVDRRRPAGAEQAAAAASARADAARRAAVAGQRAAAGAAAAAAGIVRAVDGLSRARPASRSIPRAT